MSTAQGVGSTPISPQIRVQIQAPISIESFAVNDQKYIALRFSENKGPTLAQAIAMTKGMQENPMLTIDEARKIKNNKKSNEAFTKILKSGELTYIRDPKAEDKSLVACLCNYSDGGLGIGDAKPDATSRVLILKEPGNGATVLLAKELRAEKGEVLEITLIDGQKMRIDAAAVKIVRRER